LQEVWASAGWIVLRPDEMLTGETTDAAEGTSAGTNTSMGTVLAGISSGMPLPGATAIASGIALHYHA
jgi:hypothetical protein